MSNVRQGGKLSSAYAAHDPVDVEFNEPSRTRQEFADECDINILMRKFEATGVVSHVDQRTPFYIDADDVPDLREALDVMRDAEKAFMSLPAKVRAEFDNDPLLFVEYASDASNLDRMIEWGLAPKKAEEPIVKVEVTNPAPAAPGAGSPPKP